RTSFGAVIGAGAAAGPGRMLHDSTARARSHQGGTVASRGVLRHRFVPAVVFPDTAPRRSPVPPMTQPFHRTARRTLTLGESAIRDMNDFADAHGALNLAQGMPDFPAPEILKEAACAAIMGDINQYAVTSGAPNLRRVLADKYRDWYGLEYDPETEITVTCGATEAMACVALGLFDPGDEVIVFEPFY